jgi:hypothetical protein
VDGQGEQIEGDDPLAESDLACPVGGGDRTLLLHCTFSVKMPVGDWSGSGWMIGNTISMIGSRADLLFHRRFPRH